MSETIEIGEIQIQLKRKNIKNSHLSVHPPNGRVTLVVPDDTRLEVARAYAISKLGWIRNQQEKLVSQARETPRQFVRRESHYVWGCRYLLIIRYANAKPEVRLNNRHIELTLRPGASVERRAEVIHEWHKTLLHKLVRDLISKWEPVLGVKVNKYYLQRMKTRWGSCNHRSGNIRLNTELVKKPRKLVEYVVVHELLHLIEPTHNRRFLDLMDQHFPAWPEARVELNALPLSAEIWNE
jgi:predicted metal-dependent hydrolase